MDIMPADVTDTEQLKERQQQIEEAWKAVLCERREVEARANHLEQQERQFKLKWELLIRETRQLAEDKRQFELKKRFYEDVRANSTEICRQQDNIVSGEMFFSGISDARGVKKRYKDLIKIYHPDSEGGDNATVAEINREYDNLRQTMS